MRNPTTPRRDISKSQSYSRTRVIPRVPVTAWVLALAVLVALTVSLITTAPLRASDSPDATIAAGQAAISEWVALVDAGDYGKSWRATGSLFRNQVTEAQWVAQLGAARSPFGEMVSRSEKSSSHHQQLPGAPDGDYVVVQFDTSFAAKKSAVETITAMLEDGEWRVVGYFVK
ncbi:MAG: DUF4019 domain-containing protein [Thermoanaerobaculia bacterium]|nr:DUF4019 domain-containing protein [Thermoanaerobaculia bacterium]